MNLIHKLVEAVNSNQGSLGVVYNGYVFIISHNGGNEVRVNIESSALAEGRFSKLSQEFFQGSRIETIGALVLFWFDSQEREFVSGTKEEILGFLPYFTLVENETFFKALLKYGYLKQITQETYEISGNDKHVSKLQQLRKSASIGGLASVKSRKSITSNQMLQTTEAVASTIEATVEPITMQFKAVQFNSIQDNSIQNKTKKKASVTAGVPPVITAFPTVSKKLFDTWLKTYQDEAWIKLEINKAEAWMHANPRKAPKKDFARYLNRWLSEGWETHRKTLPSTKGKVDIRSILKKRKEEEEGPDAGV